MWKWKLKWAECFKNDQMGPNRIEKTQILTWHGGLKLPQFFSTLSTVENSARLVSYGFGTIWWFLLFIFRLFNLTFFNGDFWYVQCFWGVSLELLRGFFSRLIAIIPVDKPFSRIIAYSSYTSIQYDFMHLYCAHEHWTQILRQLRPKRLFPLHYLVCCDIKVIWIRHIHEKWMKK